MNHRLSISQIEEAYRAIDPVFINSPQYECEPLSKSLGCQLILKVETLNPIRCFKGRGADWLVGQCNDKHLVCASAGNFGQAMAYACRKRKIKCTVYASISANPLKIERMKSLGAEVILFGDDFDAAKIEAKRMAIKNNLRFVEDSQDIETLAGAGTIGLELLNSNTPIDALLVPLGNGALINGIARIYKERSPQTSIIAIQAIGASAMIDSWRKGELVIHSKVATIADGIGVRLPVAQALVDMNGLVDEGLLVKEETMLEAMKLLHTRAGIVVEPSGAVGLAAILENKNLFAGKIVATIICGSNLTEEQMNKWLID
jgi:threonine dehydratase